jgi:bleomycin hydrolase
MKKQILYLLVSVLLILPAQAQRKSGNTAEKSAASAGFRFTPVVSLPATSVKDQAGTSTCWCFGTSSFIESELLRMGKGEYNISEMWIVRNNYIDRLKDNFEKQGKGNLGEGGLPHDWMTECTREGLVPEEVYSGLNYGSPRHSHGELNSMLGAVAKVSVDRRRESDQYFTVVDDILDTYLGKRPESFTYKGVGFTPKSFAKGLGINPQDYIELTSFKFIPFYTQGVVPVPDNWRMAKLYNLPLDELIAVMDNALNTGFTVDWDGDVSEKGFSHRNGYAIIPETEKSGPYTADDKELAVTQDIREAGYENKTTTDDHTMHITGMVKDQNGRKYYITKNSWGPESNAFGGYLNMSENYVKAKTILIMVHKNAIPAEIKTKLGL